MSDRRLYLVLYPNSSLVASQLEPIQFAQHYAQGSTRSSGGNFLFIEVDPDFRNDYFKIDIAYKDLKPHEDGRPKATKFISNYRTLEHIDFDALHTMFYCNLFGDYVELKPSEYSSAKRGDEMRVFIDINPTRMVALSRYNFADYGKFVTNPDSLISAPVRLYTQIDFNIEDFMTQFDANPFMAFSIPGVHPSRLRDAVTEVRKTPSKDNKGLSLNCPFGEISYKHLRRGFMFASKEKIKFYPLIPLSIVERDFFKFWKTM